MFARRNSLTLALIWIIMLAVGVFWYYSDAENLLVAVAEEQQLKLDLQKSQAEVKRLTEVKSTHDKMADQWRNSSKRIISADEPSFTLSYLNLIMSTFNLNIYYDFILNSKAKNGDVTTFTSTIAGEGPYDDLNQLVWHLTYQPILYLIESFAISQSTEPDFVKFSMKIKGFTVDSKSEINEDFSEFQRMVAGGYTRQNDIFRPLLAKKPKAVASTKPSQFKPIVPTLPKKKPGEVDVQTASLKAVTPSSVFISDRGIGMKELKVGDSVYLGRLVAIDQQKGEAEFRLNKLDKMETIILRIDQRQ